MLCSKLRSDNVGNVVIKFGARTELTRFTKEVATMLGGRLQERCSGSANAGAAGPAVGVPQFDPDGIVGAIEGLTLEGLTLENSLTESITEMVEKREDIGQALVDVAALFGRALEETVPGVDRFVAALNLVATLQDYSKAHAEVVGKIEEVQQWVLAQCKTLSTMAAMLQHDAVYTPLLGSVGDKLVELHKFVERQHPSDKPFFGQVRGYISVATFEESCDEYMQKITVAMQPAVVALQLRPK